MEKVMKDLQQWRLGIYDIQDKFRSHVKILIDKEKVNELLMDDEDTIFAFAEFYLQDMVDSLEEALCDDKEKYKKVMRFMWELKDDIILK